MPWRASSLPVTRVSSQATRSTLPSSASARSVMSWRLPIGVATMTSPSAGCRPAGSSVDLLRAGGRLGSRPFCSTIWEGPLTLSPFRRLSAWSHRAGVALSLGVAAVTLAACGGGNVAPPVTTTQAPPPQTAPILPAPAATTGAAVRVALLLPLSGNNAALGQGMLQAAQMALFDVGGNDVALI